MLSSKRMRERQLKLKWTGWERAEEGRHKRRPEKKKTVKAMRIDLLLPNPRSHLHPFSRQKKKREKHGEPLPQQKNARDCESHFFFFFYVCV